MIGKITVGTSFYECLRYCLEDKVDLSEEQKIEKSNLEQVQHKDRAEVLQYNKCFGDASKLTSQFLEVTKLNRRVEKPVYHFFLRLAPGDDLSRRQLIEMGEECVKEFGVEDNQYVMILHKDSKEPHIHIVANRVDFDGKVAKDFQNYRKMDAFCRRLEQKLHLKEVLSAKRYLPKELRHLPRHNSRHEKLKVDIQQTLERAKTYQQFEEKMKVLGYVVLKGRGICFIDEKKVRIKGSQVGFPLSKIEKIFDFKHKITQREELFKAKQKLYSIAGANESLREKEKQHSMVGPAAKLLRQFREKDQEEDITIMHEEIQMMKEMVSQIIYDLLKAEYADQSIAPELLKEARKKKKKLRPKP
ncbi:MAG: relaxase/mobilization nuclease domain-containing protein [Chitinophagaceae bacterium]